MSTYRCFFPILKTKISRALNRVQHVLQVVKGGKQDFLEDNGKAQPLIRLEGKYVFNFEFENTKLVWEN